MLEQARKPGMTALYGRARSGKSRLFGEMENYLNHAQLNESVVIGYAEASRESDLLLRAIVDCYTRCLSDSTMFDQAKLVWADIRKDWIHRLAEAGQGLAKLFTVGDRTGISSIGGILRSLKDTNEQLRTGGVLLKPLAYEQALDLLRLAHLLSGSRRLVLILDAYEQIGLAAEDLQLTLCRMLENNNKWPFAHLFIGVRTPNRFDSKTDNQIADTLDDLHDDFGNQFQTHLLGREENRLDLSDPSERGDALDWVRNKFPEATADMSDDELVAITDCHAGVLGQWREVPPRTESELRSSAKNAIQNRYPELKIQIKAILPNPEASTLAAMLALLPEISHDDQWRIYRRAIVDAFGTPFDIDPALVYLVRIGLLDASHPLPRFGHTTRYNAAREKWFDSKVRGALDKLRSAAPDLVVGLARQIDNLRVEVMPAVIALVSMSRETDNLAIQGSVKVLFECAHTLFRGGNELEPYRFSEAEDNLQGISSFIAMALSDMAVYADKDAAHERRHAALDELRKLYAKNSGNAVTRELLANRLYDAHINAAEEGAVGRRDALLAELRKLSKSRPDDTSIRQCLAAALYNTHIDAQKEGTLQRKDALLEEIRILLSDHPTDAKVRECLVRAIHNTLHYLSEETPQRRRHSLLDELHNLSRRRPNDAVTRNWFVKSLGEAHLRAHKKGDRERCSELLVELRRLSGDHPEDSTVREELAVALYNTHIGAKHEDDLQHRDALLDELRRFSSEHPGDKALLEWLASAVYNTHIAAKEEGMPARCEGLLEELRTLHAAHTDNKTVRELFMKALYNTGFDYFQEGHLSRAEALSIELDELTKRYEGFK